MLQKFDVGHITRHLGEGRGGGEGEFADEVHKCLYPKPLPLCLK